MGAARSRRPASPPAQRLPGRPLLGGARREERPALPPQPTHDTHTRPTLRRAQAVGKLPIDVNAMHIDLLSISGHKLYGPKGIGALYIRRRPRVRLEAQMSGGGQERGLRSGTVPHFLAVGGCAGARPLPPGGHAAAVRVASRSRIPRQQPGATAVPLMLAESGQRSCKLPGARTCTRQACGAPPSPPCRPGRGLRRGGARDAAGPGAHQAPERAAVQRHHIAAAGARSWLAALARQARRSALSP